MQLQSVALTILGSAEALACVRGFLLFKETHIREYLYFAFLWITAMTSSFVSIAILEGNPSLMLFKIREAAFILFFLSINLHAIRRIFIDKGYGVILFSSVAWISTAALLILAINWKEIPMIQTFYPPEPEFSTHYGIIVGNTIYSNLYPFLRNAFGIFSFSLVFYSYFFVASENELKNAKKALMLWRMTAIGGTLWSFFQTFWFIFDVSPSIRLPFALIAIIPLTIVSIKYPEGFITSHAQIYRAVQAYKFIEEQPIAPKKDQLHEYIKQVAKIVQKDR